MVTALVGTKQTCLQPPPVLGECGADRQWVTLDYSPASDLLWDGITLQVRRVLLSQSLLGQTTGCHALPV